MAMRLPVVAMVTVWLVLATMLVLVNVSIAGDSYTSVENLKRLMRVEPVLISEVELYLVAEERRLLTIKKYLDTVKKRRDGMDERTFVTHPLNAFNLVHQWVGILSAAVNNSAEISQGIANKITTHRLPDTSDLKGVGDAVLRLQRTYQLNTDDLVRGDVLGVLSDQPLMAESCYEIGLRAMEAKYYVLAKQWLIGALNKSAIDSITRQNVHPHLTAVNEELEQGNNVADDDTVYSGWAQTWKNYNALCRNYLQLDAELQSKLFCRLRRGTQIPYNAYKEEIHYLDPLIVQYHDVLTAREANSLIIEANRTLFRSKVGSYDSYTSEVRVSQQAWLFDSVTSMQIVNRLQARIQDITGFDTSTTGPVKASEVFQVLNYGTGGQYEPHFDYLKITEEEQCEKTPYMCGSGERMATFMFYFGDVIAGGGTAFPNLKIGVKPIKYSAVFWHNMRRNGDLDERTLHAGCPVLLGDKWIANKWIRESAQTFRRPCATTLNGTDV